MLTVKCLFEQLCLELSAEFRVSERWCKTVPH